MGEHGGDVVGIVVVVKMVVVVNLVVVVAMVGMFRTQFCDVTGREKPPKN